MVAFHVLLGPVVCFKYFIIFLVFSYTIFHFHFPLQIEIYSSFAKKFASIGQVNGLIESFRCHSFLSAQYGAAACILDYSTFSFTFLYMQNSRL